MSNNHPPVQQSFTTFHYDLANWRRWKSYFANTYFINHQNETYRDIRNIILHERPGIDQSIEPIYPCLALRRMGVPEPVEGQNLSLVNRGLRYPDEEMRMTMTKWLLTYNLDIYSSRREDFDELCIELYETFLRDPHLTATCEDPLYPKTSSITLQFQSITDNSDLIEDNTMRMFRATIVYSHQANIVRRYRHLRVQEIITDIAVSESDKEFNP